MFSLRSSFIDAIPPELCSFNSSSNYAKQLASKIAKPFKLKDEFKINDMVSHKLYGNGKIIMIQGIGDNSKISIKPSISITPKKCPIPFPTLILGVSC